MSISTSSMDALLAQMRNLAQQATTGANTSSALVSGATTATAIPPSNFATELKNSLDRLASTQNYASNQANAFTAGTSTASLNDVMIDLQKASLAFQTTVQARNRFVQAYQSIASMPV